MRVLARTFLFTAGVALFAWAPATTLTLPPVSRSRATVVQRADAMIRDFGRAAAQLTLADRTRRASIGRYNSNLQFSLPSVVLLSQPASRDFQPGGADITLSFDSSGNEAFPATYRQLLQSVFDAAKPTLDLLFGLPAVGGPVHVANFDASIGDRQAVAGGYYLPDNGSGVPEIRFPIYNANETAAVNFIHCLLLAYLGPDGYKWDGFEEGLVRAVTMKVARTPSALPAGLDQNVIAGVLQNSYDIGSEYDWTNQRPLGGPVFIAPNLLAPPLPVDGGSGPYLLRYLMSGTAWAKVLVEYPDFASALNAKVYANPALGGDLNGLVAAGQAVLDTQQPSNPTIEGLSFGEWVRRQYVLDPVLQQGKKVLVEATPLTSGLTTGDFGVFIVTATYFSTAANGNETLLSGTSYPIFWDDGFNRIVTDPSSEQIDITASQGSVAPNLPDLFSGQPYRAAIDVPVGDQLQRVYVPAGGVATDTGAFVSDFYGTVEGMALASGDTARVDVLIGGAVVATAPVTNDGFGILIGSAGGFAGYASLTLNLVRTSGGKDETVASRVVDKTPGAIGVDIRVGGDGTYNYSLGLAGGISMIGLPIDPYGSDPSAILGVPANSLLMARYDSSLANYALYPATEPLTIGHAYFLNLPAAQNTFSIAGRFSPGVSTSVALKPGWNMVTSPLNQVVTTDAVRVVHASDFPTSYADGQGTTIGVDFFKFVPGPPDPDTGLPETGTFVAATEFDPGVGYFVRVLAPEGLSLTFDANGLQLMARRQQTVKGYGLRVHAISAEGEAVVVVGEAPRGGNTFSSTVDSPLPPAFSGGLQAYSVKGTHLYRDMRKVNAYHVYAVKVDGLTAGESYVLRFDMEYGRIRTFQVVDLATHKSRTMFPGASWTLKAKSSTESFSIVVNK